MKIYYFYMLCTKYIYATELLEYRGLGDDHIGFSEIDIGKLDKLLVCENSYILHTVRNENKVQM